MKRKEVEFYIKCLGNSVLYIIRLISYLVPRNKEKWVVGNAKDFCNNTKYFFIYAKDVLHKQNCYWISKNKKCRMELRRLGYKAYHPWSLKGLYHLFTAYIYVYDLRVSALNFWTSGGAKMVNLWHGVGIKNVEFKRKTNIQHTHARFLEFLRRPIAFVKPDLFLSTSPLMTTHFSECFRIPESRCIESEYPRCSIFKKTRKELLQFIETYESQETKRLIGYIEKSTRCFIYMPTWRETNEDFLQKAGFNLPALEEVLSERNEIFLFKLHPFTHIKVDTSQFQHILFLNNRMDIYPILPFTDVLITDYSSIYYDYLLIPEKEIVLFPFDYEEYIAKERDLAFDFNEYTPGVRFYSFNELIDAIHTGRHFPNTKKKWITDMFWKSNRPENLYEAISSRL